MAQGRAARTFAVHRVMMAAARLCTCGRLQPILLLPGVRLRGTNETKWKDGFDGYYAKLKQAVTQTAGRIITYESEPILVLYHASSAGSTEDVENVFSQSLPYLRGVPSRIARSRTWRRPRNTTAHGSPTRSTKPGRMPTFRPPRSISRWLSSASFRSGRVNIVKLGGISVEATDLRKLADLRSTNFTIHLSAQIPSSSLPRATATAWAMSQYGAQALAKEGKDYIEILKVLLYGVDVVKYEIE